MTGLHPAALAVLVIISVFLLVGLSSATVHVDVEAPWSLDERDAFVAEASEKIARVSSAAFWQLFDENLESKNDDAILDLVKSSQANIGMHEFSPKFAAQTATARARLASLGLPNEPSEPFADFGKGVAILPEDFAAQVAKCKFSSIPHDKEHVYPTLLLNHSRCTVILYGRVGDTKTAALLNALTPLSEGGNITIVFRHFLRTAQHLSRLDGFSAFLKPALPVVPEGLPLSDFQKTLFPSLLAEVNLGKATQVPSNEVSYRAARLVSANAEPLLAFREISNNFPSIYSNMKFMGAVEKGKLDKESNAFQNAKIFSNDTLVSVNNIPLRIISNDPLTIYSAVKDAVDLAKVLSSSGLSDSALKTLLSLSSPIENPRYQLNVDQQLATYYTDMNVPSVFARLPAMKEFVKPELLSKLQSRNTPLVTVLLVLDMTDMGCLVRTLNIINALTTQPLARFGIIFDSRTGDNARAAAEYVFENLKSPETLAKYIIGVHKMASTFKFRHIVPFDVFRQVGGISGKALRSLNGHESLLTRSNKWLDDRNIGNGTVFVNGFPIAYDQKVEDYFYATFNRAMEQSLKFAGTLVNEKPESVQSELFNLASDVAELYQSHAFRELVPTYLPVFTPDWRRVFGLASFFTAKSFAVNSLPSVSTFTVVAEFNEDNNYYLKKLLRAVQERIASHPETRFSLVHYGRVENSPLIDVVEALLALPLTNISPIIDTLLGSTGLDYVDVVKSALPSTIAFDSAYASVQEKRSQRSLLLQPLIPRIGDNETVVIFNGRAYFLLFDNSTVRADVFGELEAREAKVNFRHTFAAFADNGLLSDTIGQKVMEVNAIRGLLGTSQQFSIEPKSLDGIPPSVVVPAPVAGDSLTVRVAVGPLADSVPALSEVLLAANKQWNCKVELSFIPSPRVHDSRLGTYARASLPLRSSHQKSSGIEFDGLASGTEYSLSVVAPRSWQLISSRAPVSPDAIAADSDVSFAYNLDKFVVEGMANQLFVGTEPPKTISVVAAVPGQRFEGHVMKMHGYFQLQVPPNAYSLSLALSELVLLNNFGIDAFKLSDKEHKADVAAMKPKSKTTKAHVSLVALDREHEELAKVAMVSVAESSSIRVKFWLLSNFLSPQFREAVTELATKFNFEVELVSYKWPLWMPLPDSAQDLAFAYKTLFLDVLLPSGLEQVTVMEPDLVARSDLADLFSFDLKDKALVFVPFCSGDNANPSTRLLRTWEATWREKRGSLPYLFSDLFVANVSKLREESSAQLLRLNYANMVNQNPNLSHDLVNMMQSAIPMGSLPKEWFWCSHWCAASSKASSKLLGLCSKGNTKNNLLEAEWREVINKL